MSWDQQFFDPIELPKGKKLITLREAATYITKLPKAEHDAPQNGRPRAFFRRWRFALGGPSGPAQGRPRHGSIDDSSQPPMISDELRRQADVFTDLAELQSKVERDPLQRAAAR